MPYITDYTTIPLFEKYCYKDDIDGKDITATISGTPVKLKVASTDTSKSDGYCNKSEPEDNEGMIFVFDEEEDLGFWMKGVDFPLDILFFNSSGDLVNHHTMPTVQDNNIITYNSEKPARFAVELRKGWCNDHLTDNCKLHF